MSDTARATRRLLKLLWKDFFENIRIAARLAIIPKTERIIQKYPPGKEVQLKALTFMPGNPAHWRTENMSHVSCSIFIFGPT